MYNESSRLRFCVHTVVLEWFFDEEMLTQKWKGKGAGEEAGGSIGTWLKKKLTRRQRSCKLKGANHTARRRSVRTRRGRPTHSGSGRWARVGRDSVGLGVCLFPLGSRFQALIHSRYEIRYDLLNKAILGNNRLLSAIDWILGLSIAVPDHAALGSHVLGQVDLSVELVLALAFER